MSAVSRLGIFFIAILFLFHLAPVLAQDAFFDAYVHGIELEKARNWSAAREAFLQAVAQHPEPGRRPKARGPNFTRVYDPYVRLARCEVRLGMLDEAARHLQVSRSAGVTPQPVLDEVEREIRRHASGNAAPVRQQNRPAPALSPQPADSETRPRQETSARKTPPARSADSAPRASAPPAQRPAEAQKPERENGIRITGRTIAGLALLIGLVTALAWALGRKTSKSQLPEGTWRQVVSRAVSPQTRSIKPEDTPTRAIDDLDTARPTPAGTPAPVDYTEVKKQALPLKAGAPADFGAYTLEGILGRGGMGTTYLALRKRDSLPVAIKVPHEHLLDNEEFAQRFLREGSLGSTLHHPNIIRIYEADKLGNQPYIVMELIQGETLEKKLRREYNLPLHAALEIARDIALALDYARLKGVVHRDLKPDNIMILNRGGLKVMDYGIARIVGSPGLTASEAYLGTPTYSAPEATLGNVDQQSDLYSLGIILYRMIAGDPPFRSTDPLQVLQMHRSAPLPAFPAALNVPLEAARLVRTLTEKNKSDRYRDAESFLIDLNRVLKHL